jgi:hypothetical protein
VWPTATASHPSRHDATATAGWWLTTGGSPATPCIRLEQQNRRRNRSRASQATSRPSLRSWVSRSWNLAQLEGAPGADRPSHGLGRHPGPTTRHERRVTYAPAWQQSQGRRSSRGDPWETPPSMKSVGRPPIVTAARSQAPGDASGGGSLLSRSAEKTSSSSKRSWTKATESEQPHWSEPASPGNAPRRGLWRWAEAWLMLADAAGAPVLHYCSGSGPGSRWAWRCRLGCTPPGLTECAQHRPQAHNG